MMIPSLYQDTNLKQIDFLEEVSKQIYIHFFDLQLLTSLGAYDSLSQSVVYNDLRLLLMASYEPLYMSAALIFENKFAQMALERLLPLFQTGQIQLAMKENSMRDFISTKKAQYSHAKKHYPFYWNDTWKHIAQLGLIYLPKQLDTTTHLESSILPDLDTSGVIQSAQRLGVKVDQKDVKELAPYTVEAVEGRKDLAITPLLFQSVYRKLRASKSIKQCFDIKISEHYVKTYLFEYDGTIATGLSSGINYFSYLCPTYPIHHLPLWHQVNLRLGCLSTIRELTANDIALIRETGEFHNFINEVRFLIYRAIKSLNEEETTTAFHTTLIAHLERKIRANMEGIKIIATGKDEYLRVIEQAGNILKSIDFEEKKYDFFQKIENKSVSNKKTISKYENIMNPEIFIEQEEIAPLSMALNQFAIRVNVAGERKEILESAGLETAFLSRLRFDTQSITFAHALVAAFKSYPIFSQRLNYHPMVSLLKYLCELAPIYQLEDQSVNLFTKLVLRGDTNFKALIARSAVGRIEFPKGTGIGTGVLIKNNLLLTCYHIFTKSRTEKAWIRFNYKPGSYLLDDYLFELDLDFLSFNNRFDYALLQVKGQPQQEIATLMNYTLDSGQKIYLIHHPQGQPVVISGPGEIMQVGENYIDHNIATDNGSSGAPIFDQDWKLIAIHQGHPGIGRSITSGAMGGIPIYAIFNQISSHLA